MKVLAINSSAREHGNTQMLLEIMKEELNKCSIEVEIASLANERINSCKACWACGGKGNCVQKNDCFQELFDKMKKADGIILASPVYMANISSKMQALLERAAVVADMNQDLFTHKVGVSIASVRRAGALQAIDCMNHFFLNHEMFIAGSTYWNMVYGQMPGDVMKDEEEINNIKNLANNMAFLLKVVNN